MYGSRGDVEPVVALAVRLREVGAEARVAAVVDHGAGTTTTATRAGTPQVVVPQATDQPYWAGRVAELGIGAAHDGPTPTTESLSAALRTALAPETRARATAVSGAGPHRRGRRSPRRCCSTRPPEKGRRHPHSCDDSELERDGLGGFHD
jgi:UDP:flavonoid glycosyltransferase YjiC (YdhE family)